VRSLQAAGRHHHPDPALTARRRKKKEVMAESPSGHVIKQGARFILVEEERRGVDDKLGKSAWTGCICRAGLGRPFFPAPALGALKLAHLAKIGHALTYDFYDTQRGSERHRDHQSARRRSAPPASARRILETSQIRRWEDISSGLVAQP